MKSLLCVLMVVGLCAGCATQPPSATGVLVTNVVLERSSPTRCQAGDVKHCEVDVDREKHCNCVDALALFGPNFRGR